MAIVMFQDGPPQTPVSKQLMGVFYITTFQNIGKTNRLEGYMQSYGKRYSLQPPKTIQKAASKTTKKK